MKNILLLLTVLLFSCTEKIYITEHYGGEEEEPTSYVSVSVYQWSVSYNSDNDPIVTARGKVKNHGPNEVWNVRVLIGTNYGYTRIAFPDDNELSVGDIGDWTVTNLVGTYIKDKVPMYNEQTSP